MGGNGVDLAAIYQAAIILGKDLQELVGHGIASTDLDERVTPLERHLTA